MISESHFHNWKHDEVTKTFIRRMEELKKEVKEDLLQLDVLMSKNIRITSARTAGQLDVLESILNLQYDDLIEEEEEDAEDNSVRAPSIS